MCVYTSEDWLSSRHIWIFTFPLFQKNCREKIHIKWVVLTKIWSSVVRKWLFICRSCWHLRKLLYTTSCWKVEKENRDILAWRKTEVHLSSLCIWTCSKKRKKMRSLWEDRLREKHLILYQGFPDTFFFPWVLQTGFWIGLKF